MPRPKTAEVTFIVPAEYTVPRLYDDADPDSTAHMLTLGAKAYEILEAEGRKLEHDTLYSQLKQQAADEHLPKLKGAEEALAEAQRRFAQDEKAHQELAESLKRRLQREEQVNQEIEARVREEERKARAELLAEKDKQITDMREQVSALTKSLKEMDRSIQDSLFSFKEQILKSSSNSKRKGDQGEAVFADYLRRAFGSVQRGEAFDVTNIGSEGHQGDIQMLWRGHKTMWEIKNYSTTVDQKEVSKFLRDMQEAKDVSLGVMVSMTTGIVSRTKPGNVDIEELADGRICVYLTNFMTETQDPVLYLQSLKPFLETFLHHHAAASAQTSKQSEESATRQLVERFESHRGVVMRLLKKHEEATRRFKNTILNAKKKSESIWLDIMTEMREAESNVKLLLETMLELDAEDSSSSPPLSTLPSYLFRNTDQALYGQKERKCLEELLKCGAEFHEDYSMTKKDLREALKGCGYAEDVLGKLLEQLFTEDAWNKGKPLVKYVRLKN
jgi:hypothetical protein